MRSKLFVPGSRPALFPKALASDADALSLDLEDAVDPARKDEAREQVGQWLDSLASQGGRTVNKTLIVRVNSSDSIWHAADLARMVHPCVDVINLPKAERVEQVRHVADQVAALEAQQQRQHPIGLLLNIETPGALRQAAALAAASDRVVGLQLGYADLFALTGMRRDARTAVEQTLFQLSLAAAEAGVYAYDAAYGDIANAEGYREEAELARDLGYLGKTCIHPRQVALANAVFQPSADDIAFSLNVLRAAEQARADGVGAYVVDGKMIDTPIERRARLLIDQARRQGLL